MAYTQARKSKTKGTRYVGYYLDADGKPKVAGTFASDDEALRVAREQEDHVRERRTGTPLQRRPQSRSRSSPRVGSSRGSRSRRRRSKPTSHI